MDAEPPFTIIPTGIRLAVRLTPRARRDDVVGCVTGTDGRPALSVRVSAPPVDGEANTALIAFLARMLGIAKSQLRLRTGETARTKTIDIAGPPDALAAAIRALIGA